MLTSKSGYCTYFASALGVMARIAGIPSRYIEGYLVKADESGVIEVTGENAHAWVELYFDGFGWLSFDPTPSDEPSDNPLPTPDPDGGPARGRPRGRTPEPAADAASRTNNVHPDDTPAPSLPPQEQPSDMPTVLPSDEPLPPEAKFM